MKIYYMGKRVRDTKGRFSSMWSWLKPKLAVVGLLYLMVASYSLGEWDRKTAEAEVKGDRLDEKIEELKWDLLEDLKIYEGAEKSLVTYDPPTKSPNCPEDKFSFGRYQFKVCTVKGAYKMYYGKEITKQEALEIAVDEKKSAKLAYDMIFNTHKGDKGIGHWFNSSNKDNQNLKGQLAVINKLEK